MMELVDEVKFALDGFLPWRPLQNRRSSLLSLLTICSTDKGRRLVKERGMVNSIVDAILDLNFDDPVSSTGAAALLYILAGDVDDDGLLDSPACIGFLLNLLSSPKKNDERKTIGIGFNLLEMHMPQEPNSADKGRDITSRAIISKVKELLLHWNEIKSGSYVDNEITRLGLSLKWIALLIVEKACLSSTSFEETTDMTGKAWGHFKESFRELKGLDAIFDVVIDCYSILEGWFQMRSTSAIASKDGCSASLDSVVLLLKSLKIMENATFLSVDNQNYILKMIAKPKSEGAPLPFVGTIIGCIKFLSGLSLLQSVSSISEYGNSPLSGSGASSIKGNITNLQNCPSTSYCGSKNSQPQMIELCNKRHKLYTSDQEVSTSDCDDLSATDRADFSVSTSYNTILHCSMSIDSKESSHGQSKRIQFFNDANGNFASECSDPFAFDEDNLGPSKWEYFISQKKDFQTRKQANDKEYVNGSVIPQVLIVGKSKKPTGGVNLHTSENSYSFANEKNPNLLEECLLTSVKVLINLTNDNPVGCQQIGACGGLDILASLIASHFPSFDLRIPEIEESMTSFNRSNVSEQNDRNLLDHELDFLVAILGLLVNLVEKNSLNRLRLASSRVLVNQPGTIANKEIYKDVVPLLCTIFMSNQGAGDAAAEEEDDEVLLLQRQREAEKMIIEAYTALLLAFLSTESGAVKETIARCLPDHRLKILVPVLERFVKKFRSQKPEINEEASHGFGEDRALSCPRRRPQTSHSQHWKRSLRFKPSFLPYPFSPKSETSNCAGELGTVIFLHGFPEIWYTWRHQMLAVAVAGFRAIAPDFRGYGLSDQPPEPEKGKFNDLVEDLLGILDCLSIPKAFFIGKDFGSFTVYDFAVKHPDRVQGVVNLGIPYFPWGIANMNALPEGFYVNRWKQPGRPEADFGRHDAKTVVRKVYILFSKSEIPIAEEGQEIMDLVDASAPLPPWFTEQDLEVYGDLYNKSGFRFPLQIPYRQMGERPAAEDPTIRAPALLIMGGKDYVIKIMGSWEEKSEETMRKFVPNLEIKHIPEGSHFVAEQKPAEVNEFIIDFLKRNV